MKKLPNIQNEFAEWYQEVIYQAELVDQSPVRGTMVVRPYGCALWEQMVKVLDARFKATGHENALFPLFIPESFLKREADHVEGFAPELAVVTHAGGKELEERLVVRPTSETIIHFMFARWIKSWRDLPLKINQWANVVRWEMRPRPFLRTTEFYWQEGHTAHETYQDASDEAYMMLDEYVKFANDYLAIPVITGKKTNKEKFPGAETTLTIEGIMQDGKALQMGTSHILSQSFAHAFEMKFQDRNGAIAYPFLTSWGVTTRLVGATVMVHGDQKGLVLPPRIAPIQVVIIPIFKTESNNQAIMDVVNCLNDQLAKDGIRTYVDATDAKTPGTKFYKWEEKGVPLRIEIGSKDLEKSSATIVNRIDGQKHTIPLDGVSSSVGTMLDNAQIFLLKQAEEKLAFWWKKGDDILEFGPLLDKNNGVYQTGWCGAAVCEEHVREYKATIRCQLKTKECVRCFSCKQISISDVLVAKAY